MTIPPETIEQVAAANDIVEVIGTYFPLKRAGSSFKALCPFHQEKTPSFTVSSQRQTFHCFGCGVGGSVFRFVMDYEHVDFPASVRKLAARAGVPIVEERSGQDERRQYQERSTLLKLHADAAEWFHENLIKREIGGRARDYLKNRGIKSDVAKSWKLGYAPDNWNELSEWASKQGYRRQQILASGLVKLRDEAHPDGDFYDRFRGRLIFPISNDVGEVIAFSGRVLESDVSAAKYINSPETPLFRKGHVLFGLDRTKRALIAAESAIICEGQLDLITLFEAGIQNVVAPQGTAFTENQARVLKRFVREVVLCFDSDSAGQTAAERSLEALLQNDLTVRIAEMPPGEDPDSLVRKFGRKNFDELISSAPDFFDYWIEKKAGGVNLDSIGAKMQIARDLGATVSYVREPIMRSELINKVSARLAIRSADFEKLVEDRRSGADRPRNFTARVEAIRTVPPHDVAMLCLLALRDEEARAFLLTQNWRETLPKIPGTELLGKILAADLRPADSASLNLFQTTLTPAEESVVSAWILQKLPGDPGEIAREWWNGLRRTILRRELQVAEGRMRLPNLTTGETVQLQKQVLDLRDQLHDLPQFSSVRARDT
jgi:DNA primase